MNDLKYVVSEDMEIAIFSATAAHRDVGRLMVGKPAGAGFVRFMVGHNVDTGEKVQYIECFGESVSIGIVSRGSIDADIIRDRLYRKD